MSNAYVVFVAGNLSEGYTIYGPYESFDDAADAHEFEEGWIMSLNNPKEKNV